MAAEPTRWVRLEPSARDASLAPGLEARVHDPLWLLGRQWQFGELTASADAGSAVLVRLSADVAPLTGVRVGPPDGEPAAAQAYQASAAPLEALVETEDVRAAPTARMRVRAGQHFERLLGSHGVGRYVPAYRTAYPVSADAGVAGAAGRRFLALVAGRTIDGEQLYEDLAAALRAPGNRPPLPAAPAIDAADADAVRAAAIAWLAWADALVLAPGGGGGAWVPERLQYAFGVTTDDGSRLEAAELSDGRLDWHAFDAEAVAGTGAATQVAPHTVIPSAVTYPGMPASRLWEFEDARVSFGGIEAQPEDLGRMLLAEFALVFGGDWFIIGLDVPAGTLVRIATLEVVDTFGRSIAIGPTAAPGQGAPEWEAFGLTAGASTSPDGLLVVPALASSLDGRPVEEVLLLRDETANLAWAVERTIEGEDGRPADRAQAAYEAGPSVPESPAGAPDTYAYRLRTEVPAHWLPLLPQRALPTDPSMTFRLGSLQGNAPRGRILQPAAPGEPIVVREEEVPREGARVTRAYRLARWIDGTTFLWLGRSRAVGRGEGSSGLRFDIMAPGDLPPSE